MIPAFILAGGLSRRMGRDKALVPVDGVPMALRVAQVLLEGGCGPVRVVGSQPGLLELGIPVVLDHRSGGDSGSGIDIGIDADAAPTAAPPPGDRHPLYGVASALEAAGEGLALICPCDLVSLRPEHVAALLAVGGPCVAAAEGRVHPLLAVVRAEEAERAWELARAGAGAHALTGGLPRVELPAEALRDANRPDDLPGQG